MSLINKEYKDYIAKVFECFKNTEKSIKKFEKAHGELPIPSVNELRYVGYHFLVATSETSEIAIKDNIKKALDHCKRAKFDTFEASSMILLDQLKNFNESYGKVVETQTVIENYVGKLSEIEKIKDSLEDIVSGNYENREDYYREIEPKHDALKNILQLFKLSEPKIDMLVDENNKKRKTDSRRFAITVILGILATVAAFNLNISDLKKDNSKKQHLDNNISKNLQPSSLPHKQNKN